MFSAYNHIHESIFGQQKQQASHSIGMNMLDVLQLIEEETPKLGILGLDDILVNQLMAYMFFMMKKKHITDPFSLNYTQAMMEQIYNTLIDQFIFQNTKGTIDSVASSTVPSKDKIKFMMTPDEYELLSKPLK